MERLKEAAQRFIGARSEEGCDLPQFVDSLLKAIRKKGRQNFAGLVIMKPKQVQKIAETLLGDDTVSRKATGKIAIWNKAINALNATHLVDIPTVKFFVQRTSYYVVKITEKNWLSYLKVQHLYEYFLHHHKGAGDTDDLACGAIFSMIVSGAHFRKAHTAILETSFSDFNFEERSVLLRKIGRKGQDIGTGIRIRLFLSGFSMISVMRLIIHEASKRGKTSVRNRVFPPEFLSKIATGHKFTEKFNTWLSSLVSGHEEHCKKNMDKEEYALFFRVEKMTLNEVVQGARLWTAFRYPFVVTSHLSQKVTAGPMSDNNFIAYFTDKPVIYPDTGIRHNRPPLLVSMQAAPCIIQNSLSQPQDDQAHAFSVLMETHQKVRDKLSSLSAGGVEGEFIAGEIEKISEGLPPPHSALDGHENGLLSNYRLLLQWLAWLLRQKDKQAHTADDYFGTLANLLPFLLRDTCIVSLDKYELSDLVYEVINSYSSTYTKRSAKKKIKSFLTFLCSIYPMPHLDWLDPEFWIYEEGMKREIITYSEVDEILDALPDFAPPDHVEALRVLLLLLFYCGLRIHEAALLSTEAAIIDFETYIKIMKSKTWYGRRDLPLHYLLPAGYLEPFRSFVLKRRAQSGKGSDIPLLSPDGISFYDPDSLAYMLTDIIYKVLKRKITCHQLRHSFASWFMLRWHALVYGVEVLKKAKYVDASHCVFDEQELIKLKELFLGTGPAKEGDIYFDDAIFGALKDLMGHASPDTTLNTYVHTLDILHMLFLLTEDDKTTVSPQRAAELAGIISSLTACKYFPGDHISIGAVFQYCKDKFIQGMRHWHD